MGVSTRQAAILSASDSPSMKFSNFLFLSPPAASRFRANPDWHLENCLWSPPARSNIHAFESLFEMTKTTIPPTHYSHTKDDYFQNGWPGTCILCLGGKKKKKKNLFPPTVHFDPICLRVLSSPSCFRWHALVPTVTRRHFDVSNSEHRFNKKTSVYGGIL